MTMVMLVMISCSSLFAGSNPSASVPPVTTSSVPVDMTPVLARLNEIKAMDMSTMSAKERKELRREVRTIREQVKAADSQGVYLSLGAILIIILLLVLIL
jgi:hypothetical protein